MRCWRACAPAGSTATMMGSVQQAVEIQRLLVLAGQVHPLVGHAASESPGQGGDTTGSTSPATNACEAPRKAVNFPAQPASSSPATPVAGVAMGQPVRRVRSARPSLCAQGLSLVGAVCGVFSETAPKPHCAQVLMPVETCASRSWCRPVNARNARWLARFQ